MNTKTKTHYIAQLGLLVAVEFVMKFTGMGNFPVGPLHMSFLTLPIAIGAIVLDEYASMVLGMIFGLLSFYDAMTGVSLMTSTFLSISFIHTLMLCVGMRMLMGYLAGITAKILKQYVHHESVVCFVSSLMTPLLNTVCFMSYIVAVFYRTDYIQSLVSTLHAANPFSFVVALVGMQGIVEAIFVGVIGTVVTKALLKLK